MEEGETPKAAAKPSAEAWRAASADATHVWRGRFEDGDIGAGPPFLSHPYDVVFIIRRGCARFTLGEDVIGAAATRLRAA